MQAVGIDLSLNSIQSARRAYGESDRLRFIHGDMRSLEDHVEGESFDAVSSLFTSMGYFEADADLARTIAGVAWALRSNGLFIFDFLNPEQVAHGLVEQEVKEAGGYTFTIHRRIANGWIEKSIQYADSTDKAPTPCGTGRRCRQMAGVSTERADSSLRRIMAIMPWLLGAKTLRAVYSSLEKIHVVSRFHIVVDCYAWGRCVRPFWCVPSTSF